MLSAAASGRSRRTNFVASAKKKCEKIGEQCMLEWLMLYKQQPTTVLKKKLLSNWLRNYEQAFNAATKSYCLQKIQDKFDLNIIYTYIYLIHI